MRVTRGLASIIVVVSACAACQSGSPSSPTSSRPASDHAVPRSGHGITVSGTVRDFATNAGVAGATVLYLTESANLTMPNCCVTAVTDAAGSYALTLSAQGSYIVFVDGQSIGIAGVVKDAAYRGDVFVHAGTCISRYGTVADSSRQRVVSGATVSLAGKTAVTGSDGWYRIDFNCPATVFPGNTTFMTVSDPDYVTKTVVVGRGVNGVERLDVFIDGGRER